MDGDGRAEGVGRGDDRVDDTQVVQPFGERGAGRQALQAREIVLAPSLVVWGTTGKPR